jgi:nucleotide-binding universal stress UspA family protein
MDYKSIAVHVDTSAQARARIAVALRLAKQFDAHLTAVYAVFAPDPQTLYVMAGSAQYYAEYEGQRAERAAAEEQYFKAELEQSGIQGDWEVTGPHEDIPVTRRGRCADIIVAGQEDPDDPESYVGDHFAENLIMSSGRPVLLIPYAGVFTTIGTEVMIAWDGSREATRAVYDAMPFLVKAGRVSVVTVDEAAQSSFSDRIPGQEIAVAIERHGVNVQVRALDGVQRTGIGEALLSEAADLNADLMVMGAYGHARWQEMVLGGATRTVVASATLPVLFSH